MGIRLLSRTVCESGFLGQCALRYRASRTSRNFSNGIIYIWFANKMDYPLATAISVGCCSIVYVLIRYYSKRAKLPEVSETWWTPGTENSVSNDVRPCEIVFSEEVIDPRFDIWSKADFRTAGMSRAIVISGKKKKKLLFPARERFEVSIEAR